MQEWLASQPTRPVTKEELQKYLDANETKLSEVVLGDNSKNNEEQAHYTDDDVEMPSSGDFEQQEIDDDQFEEEKKYFLEQFFEEHGKDATAFAKKTDLDSPDRKYITEVEDYVDPNQLEMPIGNEPDIRRHHEYEWNMEEIEQDMAERAGENLAESQPYVAMARVGEYDFSFNINPNAGEWEVHDDHGTILNGSGRNFRDMLLDARSKLFDYLHENNIVRDSDADEEGSNTQYGQYTLGGGENYREMLMTLPENPSTDKGPKGWGDTAGGTHDTSNFRGGHFDEPNIVAHIRFKDRTGPNGEKLLHIEEIQSDWHQKGRSKGYRGPKEEIDAVKKAHKEAVQERNMLIDDKMRAAVHDITGDGGQIISRGGYILKNPPVGQEHSYGLFDANGWRRTGNRYTTEEEAKESALNMETMLGYRPTVGLVQHARPPITLLQDNGVQLGEYASKDNAIESMAERLIDDDPDVRAIRKKVHDLSEKYNKLDAGVPNAPFKTSWSELAFKRMLRYAAEHNYDKITWTTGAQQVDRYGNALRDHVDSIRWKKTPEGIHLVGEKNGSQIVDTNQREDELTDAIGKAMAEQIIKSPDQEGKIEGNDITISDTGMAGFYDRILPQMAAKFGKKFGAKVSKTRVMTGEKHDYVDPTEPDTSGWKVIDKKNGLGHDIRQVIGEDGQPVIPELAMKAEASDENAIAATKKEYMNRRQKLGAGVHQLDITPELKDSVMKGQPLFKREGNDVAKSSGKMLAKGLSGEPTKEFTAKEAEFVKAVNDIRDKMFPKAETRFMKSMRDTHTGEDVKGAYYRDLTGKDIAPVIAASLRGDDPTGTARHEGIHFLKRNGYFTKDEWNTLATTAKDRNWIAKHGIDKRYKDADEDTKTEEAIAEEFGKGNGWKGAPEAVKNIFRKVALFMRRLAAAARVLMGKKATAEDIFNRVETGEVGNREQQKAGQNDEAVYQKGNGGANKQNKIKEAVDKAEDFLEKKFSGTLVERAAQAYQHMLAPESVSDKAVLADALTAQAKVKEQNAASAIAQVMQKNIDDWDKKSEAEQKAWIKDYETGKSNHPYDAVHKAWMDATHKAENAAMGKSPDDYYRDNYVAHIFEKPEAVQKWIDAQIKRYGNDWFQKKRTFDLVEQAEAAGFKLRTYNPAELDQMRMMAGSDMIQKQKLLERFAKEGLAAKKSDKPVPPEISNSYNAMTVRGPDSKEWLLHGDIAPLWHNAMEMRGLWGNQTVLGDAYRGWQLYRKAMLPIKLGLSLFHPFHVYTIHWGTGISSAMENAIKAPNLGEAASGFKNGILMALKGGFGPEGMSLTRPLTQGGSLMQRLKSIDSPLLQAVKTPPAKRTPYQQMVVQRFEEAGFNPQMSEKDKIHFRRALVKAFNNKQYHKLFFPAVGGAIRALAVPFMEHWIPAMKAEALMMRTNMALRRDPSLATDGARRAIVFRQITKDLERTYGEMNYDTLFWNKNLRDAATGSFISAGWKLAQLYYYMGHPFVQVPKLLRNWAKTGKMEFTAAGMNALRHQVNYQSLFYLAYMGLSLAAGGAITYMLTGQKPKDRLDLQYPRTGDVQPDGTPVRISLPFFNKEYDSWKYNIDQRGPVMGTASFVGNMTMPPEVYHTLNNEDSFGNPLVDNFNWEELSHAAINQFQPISMSLADKAALKGSEKAKFLSYLGAGVAPAYAGQSTFQNKVAAQYYKEHPPSSSEYQKDMKNEYKLAVMRGDTDAQQKIADKLEKTGMSGKQITSLVKEHTTPFTEYAWKGTGSKFGWQGLSAESQIRLYKYATPEEKQNYFPMMKKEAKAQVEPPPN